MSGSRVSEKRTAAAAANGGVPGWRSSVGTPLLHTPTLTTGEPSWPTPTTSALCGLFDDSSPKLLLDGTEAMTSEPHTDTDGVDLSLLDSDDVERLLTEVGAAPEPEPRLPDDGNHYDVLPVVTHDHTYREREEDEEIFSEFLQWTDGLTPGASFPDTFTDLEPYADEAEPEEDSPAPVPSPVGSQVSTLTSSSSSVVRDAKYWQRRRKNNIASQKSRLTRKQKRLAMEAEREQLRAEKERLTADVSKLEQLAEEWKKRLLDLIAQK